MLYDEDFLERHSYNSLVTQAEQACRIVRNDAVYAHGLGCLNVSRFVDGVDEDSKRTVVKGLE